MKAHQPIREYAFDHNVDLVAIGGRKSSLVSQVLLGSAVADIMG
jgi:nucleotide-binding universal stress UspA family protein